MNVVFLFQICAVFLFIGVGRGWAISALVTLASFCLMLAGGWARGLGVERMACFVFDCCYSGLNQSSSVCLFTPNAAG